MTDTFRLLATGRFTRDQLHVLRTEQPRPTTPDLEASIERHWRAAVRRARRRGVQLYPGPLCRLVDYGVQSDCLRLTLGPTDFRALVGTHWAQPEQYGQLDPECFANAVGVSAALRTADGCVVVVKRGRGVAHHPGWFHVPSGHLEPEPHACDPFRAIEGELEEELGVRADELSALHCLGLVLAGDTYKPELVFEARARLTAEEVLARFQPGEHQAVRSVPDRAPALRRLLSRYRRVTYAARACLELYARAAHGSEWRGSEGGLDAQT